MKRAVLLHGTSGSPSELAWEVNLAAELGKAGYDVFFPQLPDCDAPDLAKYDDFLKKSDWDFADNVVIGHSSGATTLLHLLQQDWFPDIKVAVLVGTFLNERLLAGASWYVPGQFDKLFVDTFDIEKIQSKADKFYFVHGDNDPYCDYDEAQQLCSKLGGEFLTVHQGGHLAKSADLSRLDVLNGRLHADHIL